MELTVKHICSCIEWNCQSNIYVVVQYEIVSQTYMLLYSMELSVKHIYSCIEWNCQSNICVVV